MDIEAKRKRGKPKMRWSDKVEEDLKEKRWRREESFYRKLWTERYESEKRRMRMK